MDIDCAKVQSILSQTATGYLNGERLFRIHYWGATQSHFNNPVHKHSFYEVCYVLAGKGAYVDDGHVFSLTDETMFCSRPGIWHQIRSDTGLFLLFVAFDVNPNLSDKNIYGNFDSLKSTARIVVDGRKENSSALLWKGLILQSQNPHAVVPGAIRSAALALLTSFYSTFTDRMEPTLAHAKENPSADLLRHATTFIKDNLSQPIRLTTVSDYFHVSGRHLSRVFQKELHMSFAEYVQRERMKQASDLLRYSSLPIKEIAAQTGYSSVHYFTRSFRKFFGSPPGAFRHATNAK